MVTWYGEVESTQWLTPVLVRVVLGGEGLAGFAVDGSADTYVNLAIPPAGAPYSGRFDPAQVREEQPKELWPARRRYTIRAWDGTRATIDFVVHGDAGVGGPWAANAAPGDILVFEGPGGGYRPDPEVDWHLLIGDESALPAIAAALEVIPAGRPVVVRLLCDGPEHELPLTTPGALDLAWLHRTGGPDDVDLLASSVSELDFPAGRADAFVHGEAGEIRAIRRHLLLDRGMERSAMSCSPYWRRTMTDEAWRQVKRDFVAAMEADAPAAR